MHRAYTIAKFHNFVHLEFRVVCATVRWKSTSTHIQKPLNRFVQHLLHAALTTYIDSHFIYYSHTHNTVIGSVYA